MALLLAIAMTAASILWNIEQRINSLNAAQQDRAVRLGRVSETIAGIGAAQQSYVAPGQLDEPWFERTSALVDVLSSDLEQAGNILRSPEAAEALQALAGSTDVLMTADARVRQNLRLGQELMASDVIFSDGRNILDGMVARLRGLEDAERAHHRAELGALSRWRWIALGATALMWMAGFFGFAVISASSDAGRAPRETSAGPPAEQRSGQEARPSVDLASAAGLCTDLSRVITTTALPELLGRAARVLDASGLILWMSAGEQLFPVMAHGYREEMLSRFGPIARDADNATAGAWRTGQLTIVGGTATDNGAIVTPLFGLHSCIGVLAAEVRGGAEDNPTTQAVATMIAAQLATVVPAWPAVSLTRSAAAEPNAEAGRASKEATREVRSA